MSTLLAGVTVLDISEYIAGPYSASLLADLGARVIKVEPPDGAEERRIGSRERYRGDTRMSLVYNRGKKSLAIDLRQAQGREAIHKLVRQVDIVIQNFAPSVAKKLGIDYESLQAVNPRLIFISSTAFGEVGPYQKRKGFDIIAHAASGIMSNYADENGAPRGPGAINYMDICTGMFNAMGLLAALYHREKTGQGQKLETSLFSYWIERLEATGVPCGPVSYRPNLYDDPQVAALDMMWKLDNARMGSYLMPGHPVRYSKTPVAPGKGSPTLGENSTAVLREIGYSDAAIAELRTAGIVK